MLATNTPELPSKQLDGYTLPADVISGKLTLSDMIIQDHIAPGLQELAGARESLPQVVKSGQCVIACYTEQQPNNYVIAGYYLNNGIYNGRICLPDNFSGDISPKNSVYSKNCKSVPNCESNVCWAGGDTGGFYLLIKDSIYSSVAPSINQQK